jgi:predicted nucleic acid-binding protein
LPPSSPPAFRFPPAIVIDCHFLVFALTLTSVQRQAKQRPPEYQLIEAFEEGRFMWVWHDDILAEYQDVIDSLIAKHQKGQPTLDKKAANRIIRDIRTAGLYAPITDADYAAAQAVVMAPARPADERDEDDVIYLAAAGVSDALALVSNDRSLKNLRPPYKGIPVISDLPAFLALVGYQLPGVKSSTKA